MIDFQRMPFSQKEAYEQILFSCPPRGCEYSFTHLYLWGRQETAFLHGCVAFFSHFYGRSVYPYPIGIGDKRAVLEAILAKQGYQVLYALITSENAESIAFHAKTGYEKSVEFPNCGYKFNRWLGLIWMEKRIKIVQSPSAFPTPWPAIVQGAKSFSNILDNLSIPYLQEI